MHTGTMEHEPILSHDLTLQELNTNVSIQQDHRSKRPIQQISIMAKWKDVVAE